MAIDPRLQECLDCVHSIGRDKGERCDESLVTSPVEDIAGYQKVGDGKCHAFNPRDDQRFDMRYNSNCSRCFNASLKKPGERCVGGRMIGKNSPAVCSAFMPIPLITSKKATRSIHLTAEGIEDCVETMLEAFDEYPEKMKAVFDRLGINVDDLKNRRDFKMKKGITFTEAWPA